MAGFTDDIMGSEWAAERPATFVPTRDRPADVRCSMAVSCRHGMLLCTEDMDGITWEVVRFGSPHVLLATFQHGPDALALYNASIKGQ